MTNSHPTAEDTIQARWHFGIPIYEKHLPGYSALESAVMQHVHQLKETGTGMRRSNQGGWHSDETLHMTEHPETRQLIHSLLQVACACIGDFEGERKYKDIQMVGAWANINQKGDWNAPHEHMPCTWSGVFYLDAGEPLGHDNPAVLDGKILFFDPLPLGQEWKRPPNVVYRPKTGTMLLFPSFLTHMVAPYFGDKPRISLAFNLRVLR